LNFLSFAVGATRRYLVWLFSYFFNRLQHPVVRANSFAMFAFSHPGRRQHPLAFRTRRHFYLTIRGAFAVKRGLGRRNVVGVTTESVGESGVGVALFPAVRRQGQNPSRPLASLEQMLVVIRSRQNCGALVRTVEESLMPRAVRFLENV
jgi:hypothetical protein